MKWMCETHKIEVDETANTRKFSGLNWAGTPQCKLFTMVEYKEGIYDVCVVKKV